MSFLLPVCEELWMLYSCLILMLQISVGPCHSVQAAGWLWHPWRFSFPGDRKHLIPQRNEDKHSPIPSYTFPRECGVVCVGLEVMCPCAFNNWLQSCRSKHALLILKLTKWKTPKKTQISWYRDTNIENRCSRSTNRFQKVKKQFIHFIQQYFIK